jgi:hypothetical protein
MIKHPRRPEPSSRKISGLKNLREYFVLLFSYRRSKNIISMRGEFFFLVEMGNRSSVF